MTLFEHIKKVLSQNEKYCEEGQLFKNAVVEAGLKLDPTLLKLLLKDEKAKKHFFEEVDNIPVFDKVKFQKFVSNKQFLPDSFTAFKNKIGLTANREYLTEANEVVLDFPYKDCVLEGGQTKEDQKRQEIFWNETLAPDEIDRMFEPKALTKWKKYTSNGVENVSSISEKDNLIIKGNNLISLHSLAKVFSNKIKLIYIDPPYNTGNDSFQYNDSFNHSSWLTFMKNRLEIAWKLVSNDGSIFIQVDDSEFAYLKVLCDEVFGRNNFREAIVLKSSTESGVNAINVKRGERLFKVKEYILFYSKNTSFRFKPFFTKADFNENYKYEVIKNKKGYTVTDLSKKYKDDYSKINIPKPEKDKLSNDKFKNYALNNAENIYSLEKNIKKSGDKFKEFAKKNKDKGIVEEYLNSKGELKLIYQGGVFVPLAERTISEGKDKSFGVLASDLWVDIGTTPSNEGGIKFSNGKKPEKLLKRIIEMATNEGDIVMDYHLGSGTTAAVAHKMKRQYIGLEQMDYGENDCTVRLQKVIEGEQSGISKIINWSGGGSFVYAELAKLNNILIEDIINSKNVKQTLDIFNELLNNYNIDYRLNVNKLIDNEHNFTSLSLEEQKKLLISFIEKNDLYINLYDIYDEDLDLKENNIKLNKSFYKT